uniref:Uncharacterized protein n=1 Tax=Ananas comosus var. bracteatus TaxID=296719 RepID=A0A6V7NTI3_ANACO|nr:unnamed protein product [Ananas comosus var. bracteatus]
MASSSAPKLLIRAPLSSEDNDSPFSSDPDEMEEEEGFGTASEGDEDGDVPRGGAAPRERRDPWRCGDRCRSRPLLWTKKMTRRRSRTATGIGSLPWLGFLSPIEVPPWGERRGLG